MSANLKSNANKAITPEIESHAVPKLKYNFLI